jgi:hypothetical protein
MTKEIYRYTFTSGFMDRLNIFTQEHVDEGRIEFKDSWTRWIKEEDIKELILKESEILMLNGYKENILEKMFTCVRYYMKKRDIEKDEYVVEKKKMNNKHISSEIAMIINEHIRSNLLSRASPAKLFTDFSLKHKELAKLYPDKVKQKKVYKNRYYLIRNEN